MPETATGPPAEASPVQELTGMSFLEHLEELRRRIIYALLAVIGGFLVAWGFADRIFALMERPILAALESRGLPQTLVYLNPTEPFNIYLKVGFIGGLFLASPLVLYQVWLFVSPGLYRHEKRWVIPFMFFSVGLFLMGGYFGYAIAYPAALDFLIGYGAQFQPMITISEYTNLFLTVIIGLGIIFEMPVLIFFLALMGVVSAGFLWRNLRYAILLIFIVAAVLTPTSDIPNMIIFAAPMVALYLVSILLAWFAHRFAHPRRRRTKA